jgi:hypothetical protein
MSITEKVFFNDDGYVVQREQRVAGIVDYCKARHNEGRHGFKDFKLMGKLPEEMVNHYCAVNKVSFREFLKNPEHVKRMINDPALADFRIAPGRM